MKNIILSILILLCLASQTFAEENIQELSGQNQERIQNQIQEMTQTGISELPARRMLTHMIQNQLNEQTQYQIRQMIISAAKDGLPTAPLINKTMEGMAKKVKEQHLVEAVKTVWHRYRYAYQEARTLSFDHQTTQTMTQTMADCMAAGIQKEDMAAVMDQLRLRIQHLVQERNQADQNLLAIRTMQTIRTMAREGKNSADISYKVCKALINKYTSRQMADLHMQTKGSDSGNSPGLNGSGSNKNSSNRSNNSNSSTGNTTNGSSRTGGNNNGWRGGK